MQRFLFLVVLIVVMPLLLWMAHERTIPGSEFFPPYDLSVISTPGDTAGSITLNWFKITGDDDGSMPLSRYTISRSENVGGPFTEIAQVEFKLPSPSLLTRQLRDTTAAVGQAYFFKIGAEVNGKVIESNVVGPVVAESAEQSGAVLEFQEILFPPTQLRAFDTPNDAGSSITLEWKISPNDVSKSAKFNGYDIYRSKEITGPFALIGDATGGESDLERHVKTFADGSNMDRKSAYYYYVEAKWDGQTARSNVAGPVKAGGQWFHTGRLVSLVLLGILVGTILWFINRAKSGRELFIRKIAGLEAVDEAVGRATEMGKKVFYIPGTQDMDNVQTIAGLTILSRVARLTAEYETKLEVPVSRSLVMVTAREVVKEAYLNAGRPDFYSDDMVYYLTDDQFGYAAGIDGMVVRQKPATIFYQGAFYAESLLLAETGNSIGAIQIAGTAMPAQLPFFVAACDYTLIGEELFAASAYLSREPKLLGSLKGQDIGGKLVFLTLALIFIAIVTFGAFASPELVAKVNSIFTVH
ncbi:MAG: hypothetical protein A2W25_01685 [candidate division Zixibacteria bacterium RBG_16_53_22]|nr:MAG: hypothetical protein A2W25_01685 [candidate division Zixibacteria bacterium RBG_16_53_22]